MSGICPDLRSGRKQQAAGRHDEEKYGLGSGRAQGDMMKRGLGQVAERHDEDAEGQGKKADREVWGRGAEIGRKLPAGRCDGDKQRPGKVRYGGKAEET